MCATYWVDDGTVNEIVEIVNMLNKKFGYETVTYDQIYPYETPRSGDIYPKYESPVGVKIDSQVTVITPQWGFPRIEKDVVFNTRSDKVKMSNFWKYAYGRNRGFVVCNGFYENKRDEDGKNVRYLFTYPDAALIFIAAIIETKKKTDGTYQGYYSLMTTEPNESVGRYITGCRFYSKKIS